MAANKAMEFFEKLVTEPKAKELLSKQKTFTNEEEALSAYLCVAKELGYDITGDDLSAAIETFEQEQKDRTENAASAVKALADDDLRKAAGGSDFTDAYCTEELWHIPTPPGASIAGTCKNLLHKPCKHTFDRS